MSDHTYFNPVRIISGLNAANIAARYLPSGKSLIITDPIFSANGTAQKLINNAIIFDRVTPNPELDDIDSAVASFKKEKFESIIALGGGSVIDFAKAAAVFVKENSSRTLNTCLREQSDVVPNEKIFLMAIPTTAGTGSEVTPFATIWDSSTQKKHSLAGDVVFPSITILDPILTVGLPHDVTLATGLDVLSHSLESLWNKNRTPVSEAYALQSLRMALKAFPSVLSNPGNLSARADMQWASTLAGFAISQTRTAIAHSISYPLTIKFGVPHGLACGFTLPELINVFLDKEAILPEVKNIMEETLVLLRSLKLGDMISKYANPSEIIKLSGEMYNPARADNYLYKADDRFIIDLLTSSIK